MMDYRTINRLAAKVLWAGESNAEIVRLARAWKDARAAVTEAIRWNGTQAATLAERRAEDQIMRLRQAIARVSSEHELRRGGPRK